jgi:hypothetical protein
MSNLNKKVSVLSTLQAAGADVSLSNGVLSITGTPSTPVRNIADAAIVASLAGLPVVNTITSTAAVAGSTTYSGNIVQEVEGRTYSEPFSYTTPTVAPSDTNFYASIAALIQGALDGGQLVGTVSSTSGGVVFTGTVDAPIAGFTLSNLSVSSPAKTLTAAGSSATNATPRVFTAGAAHGLTVGKIYRITFVGVTGTGAADLNKEVYGLVASATTITLFNTSNTGTVDTTTASSITVANDGRQTFASDASGITGYSAATNYIGLDVSFLSQNNVDAGIVQPQLVLGDATNNSVAVANAFIQAIIAALNGSNAAEMSAAL